MSESLNPNGIRRNMTVRYTGRIPKDKDARCYERGQVHDLYHALSAGRFPSLKAGVCFGAKRVDGVYLRCPACYSYDVRNLEPVGEVAA